MAYYERMDEAVRYGPVCRRDIRFYSEQEQQIYKYVLENGFITTAETVEILDVKHRRARAVLLNMVKDGYLRKEGAARSTIYIKNKEER
ncbi:MAG: hypothetical protein ACLUBO_09645 [Coprococcus sp.]